MSRLLAAAVAATLAATAVTTTATAEPGAGVGSGVEHVRTLPHEAGTAQAMALRGNRLVVHGSAGFAVYDVTDRADPKPLGRLTVPYRSFSSELEASPDLKVVLLRQFGYTADGDNVLRVFDLSGAPRERGSLAVTDGAFSCVLRCTWAYGDDGSVVDLRRPGFPRLAAGPGTWNRRLGDAGRVVEARNGLVVTVPSKGVFDDRILTFRVLDVRDPLRPRLVASGASPHPRLSFHDARWAGGDVLLMQTVFNGEGLSCSSQAQGELLAYDASRVRAGTLRLAGRGTVRTGRYADGSPAVTATLSCDGYGIDEHPAFRHGGLVAQSHGEHGVRFVRVGRGGTLSEEGYWLPFGTRATDAEWADARVVYVLDAARGVTVLRWKGAI